MCAERVYASWGVPKLRECVWSRQYLPVLLKLAGHMEFSCGHLGGNINALSR